MSRAEPLDSAPVQPPGTPYRLLWLTGTAGTLLALITFVLWGLGGSGLLLDMIAAFCV